MSYHPLHALEVLYILVFLLKSTFPFVFHDQINRFAVVTRQDGIFELSNNESSISDTVRQRGADKGEV